AHERGAERTRVYALWAIREWLLITNPNWGAHGAPRLTPGSPFFLLGPKRDHGFCFPTQRGRSGWRAKGLANHEFFLLRPVSFPLVASGCHGFGIAIDTYSYPPLR